MEILILVLSLVAILIGAEAFTNALEHVGERLRISEGVTGSIFAAVGTAMPEAMVPVVAILAGTGSLEVRHEVGVGAILGAPMMLSTLALFLMAAFAAHRRGWQGGLTPEPTGLNRDLAWFLVAFSMGAVAIFIPYDWRLTRGMIALGLVLMYFLYILLTIRASNSLVSSGHGTEADHPLYLSNAFLPTTLPVILVQLGMGFGLIIGGAKGFVYGVEHLSSWLDISALALSLVIIPIATELPEKVNSILWIRRGRDTLAFGNITGAMMFQGSLLPALGIFLTPWEPRAEVLYGVSLTLIASAYLFICLRRGPLHPYHLVVNGLCYIAYFVLVSS